MCATSLYDTAQVERSTWTDEPDIADESWRNTAGSSLGALPWWMTSVAVHGALLLLAMLIVMGGKLVAVNTEDVPHAKIVTEPPKKEKPVMRHKVKSKSQVNIEAESDRPFYTPEKLEVSEAEIETENEDRSEFPARGHQDAVSTIPAEGTGTIGFFGVGAGGASGAFGWRTGGGRKRRAMRFGGSQASEGAVDMGLEWLFNHQEEDGRWDRLKWLTKKTKSFSKNDNAAMTGIAVLAFLGAGHTEKHGKYQKTVSKGVQWLISKQGATQKGAEGSWYHAGKDMYRCGIATMALSEAAGMGRVPGTVTAAQKAIDGLVKMQKPYEAWDYAPFAAGREAKHENDMSITIWAAMALKSGKVAGLKVPGTAFGGVMKWVDHAQDLTDARAGDYNYKGGRAGYRGRMTDPHPIKVHDQKQNDRNLLTAAAGVIRVFWGQPNSHPGITGPSNIILEEALPGKAKRPSYYAWYYATLLMFQKGGQHWETWNKAMQPYLLGKQLKGDPKELGGSWDPVSAGSFCNYHGGRVFSTSLAVLSLEVYYRYLPMYGE